MKIGIYGLGAVGGTLMRWFKANTDHELLLIDPAKNYFDEIMFCDAVFICIPVPSDIGGQDLSKLRPLVKEAKKNNPTATIFIRSTVLPGTNDELKTTACPEFLTERQSDKDMNELPVLMGVCSRAKEIFPGKEIVEISNVEAEIAKYAHNVMGAIKVNFFNMIYKTTKKMGGNYENVLRGTLITGHINKQHTQVPGPDGQFGYGGKCFPENVKSFHAFIRNREEFSTSESLWLKNLTEMNTGYRGELNP